MVLEKLRRIYERLVYVGLNSIKQIITFQTCARAAYFGPIRKGPTTAAFMKARRLVDLFGNHPFRNNLLYICSGNVPLWYCLREKKRGTKLVVNQNGVYYPGWYGPEYAAANERHLAGYYRAANYIIFQSAFCEESSRRYLGDPSCPYRVLYNPVDTSIFLPAVGRGFIPYSPVFLSTGIFYSEAREERLRLVLESFALVRMQLPQAQLIVAGHIAPQLEKVAALGGDGVRFTGPYTRDEAPKIYQQGDIYLSTQFNDPCPSAVLEAMSCGLPVVHLACGGTPELVGEAGIAVAVEKSWDRFEYPTPELFATAMLEAVRQRDSLSKIARQSCVERFDLQIWKQRHEEIFREVCG